MRYNISKYLIIIILLFIVLNYKVYKVDGDSMYPMYKDGEYIIAKTIYNVKPITYYKDKVVVVYVNKFNMDILLIKKVVSINTVNNTVQLESINKSKNFLDNEIGDIPIKNIRGVVVS